MTAQETLAIRDLAGAVASGMTFGRLMARGVDVDRLILRETDVQPLEAALQKTRAIGDLRWGATICRRLVRLTGSPAHCLDLARSLVWSMDFHGADEALRQTVEADFTANVRTVVDCQIALGLRDEPRARQAIEALSRAGGEVAPWQARLIAALMSWGKQAEARHAFEAAIAAHGMTASLATLDVRLMLMDEGPKAALQRLDELSHLLPPATEVYRALKLSLLNERGRHNEALDLALLWLDEMPLAVSIYGHAMHAAQHCDRVIELGDVLSGINARYPAVPELLETLCNYAIDQGDAATAAELLEAVRERSSWTWMIMQFGAACQTPNDTDVEAFLQMLEADGIRFPGPYILYALFNYYFHADEAGLRRAQRAVDRLIPAGMDDSGLIALHLRLLIALDRDAEAKAFFDRLPRGVTRTAVLAPFGLYFLVREGRDSEAMAGWTRYLAETSHMALNARSSYPEEINLRYAGSADDILAFITVFNGIEYLDWFLDYYRKLGVAHFFFCDNGSNDGTFEFLQSQPDVSLFRNSGSFAASACGVFWVNHLMRRFGVGHWCLHLDMDEALVFPGLDQGRSLREFTQYLDANGFAATSGCMIDIYPDALDDDTATNAFEASRYIDTDYVWMRNELPPYHFVKGGVRGRLTGRSLLMTKAPLVKMRADTAYIANNHQHTHLPIADVTVALLHYKFIGAFRDRVAEAVDRQEHFQGARFYRVLQASFGQKNTVRKLTSDSSKRYSTTSDLINFGLMRTSDSWTGIVR